MGDAFDDDDFDDSDWEYLPSADPQIRKDYELALGEFLVVFNGIENIVDNIIGLAVADSGRQDILKYLTETYAQRLTFLDLLTLRYKHIIAPEALSELRQLGGHRNMLAHGHFDQNPFDGSYEIVSKAKRKRLSVEAIRKLTGRATSAYQGLRATQAFYEFKDVSLPEDIVPLDKDA